MKSIMIKAPFNEITYGFTDLVYLYSHSFPSLWLASIRTSSQSLTTMSPSRTWSSRSFLKMLRASGKIYFKSAFMQLLHSITFDAHLVLRKKKKPQNISVPFHCSAYFTGCQSLIILLTNWTAFAINVLVTLLFVICLSALLSSILCSTSDILQLHTPCTILCSVCLHTFTRSLCLEHFILTPLQGCLEPVSKVGLNALKLPSSNDFQQFSLFVHWSFLTESVHGTNTSIQNLLNHY